MEKKTLRRADVRDFEMCELISDDDGLRMSVSNVGILSLRGIDRLASSQAKGKGGRQHNIP